MSGSTSKKIGQASEGSAVAFCVCPGPNVPCYRSNHSSPANRVIPKRAPWGPHRRWGRRARDLRLLSSFDRVKFPGCRLSIHKEIEFAVAATERSCDGTEANERERMDGIRSIDTCVGCCLFNGMAPRSWCAGRRASVEICSLGFGGHHCIGFRGFGDSVRTKAFELVVSAVSRFGYLCACPVDRFSCWRMTLLNHRQTLAFDLPGSRPLPDPPKVRIADIAGFTYWQSGSPDSSAPRGLHESTQ